MRDRYFVVILIVMVVLIEFPFVEYITDDTFIHLQFAKNLISGNGFSFNSGEPTYGFTSPLWVLLISAGGLLGGDLLLVSKALGIAALLVCGIFFYLLVLHVSADRYLSRAATLVWILNGWSVRWGLSGMETSLVTAWVVVSFYSFARETQTGSPRYSPWILALASLVRPEAIALPLILCAASLLRKSRGSRKFAFSIVAPSLVVSLVWFVYALIQFGRLTPNTVAVKAGRFIAPERIRESVAVVAKIFGSTNGPELLLIVAALLVAVASRRLPGALSGFHVAAGGWLVLLPTVYVLRDVQIVSRYLVPVLPLLVLYGFLSLRWFLDRKGFSRVAFRSSIKAVGTICILLNLWVLAFVVHPHTYSFSKDLRGSLVYLGRWFAKNTPPGTSIAVPDIGAFAYYSDRKVVDLGGLVTPSMIPILREHELDEVMKGFLFAEVARPDYVIDRAQMPNRLLEEEELRQAVEPLVTVSVSSLGITRPRRYFYTAYRVNWEKLSPEGASM